jgi:hypothetical protein
MTKKRTHRVIPIAAVIGMAMALSGCYTVMTHPTTSPDQYVTDSGEMIAPDNCAGCHSGSELWSYHHRAYWLAPSHRHSLSGYYAYRYDHLFLGTRYYDPYYYDRWASYYYSPWWGRYKGPRYHPTPGVPSGSEPGPGRGALPDNAQVQELRDEYIPLLGPGSGPMSFSRPLQPVATNGDQSAARAGQGTTDSDSKGVSTSSDAGRGAAPTSVTPVQRPPSQSPPPPSTSSSGSASKQSTQSNDDDDSSDGGRGSTPSGAEPRRR